MNTIHRQIRHMYLHAYINIPWYIDLIFLVYTYLVCMYVCAYVYVLSLDVCIMCDDGDLSITVCMCVCRYVFICIISMYLYIHMYI
jgi:hypothetical protein